MTHGNPVTKISEVNKGIALLDQALAKDQNNYVIRIVRINNSLSLPGFLGRANKAKLDLEFLVELFKQIDAPADARGEVYLKLGRILVKENKKVEANIYFKQAIDADSNSEWSKQARIAIND